MGDGSSADPRQHPVADHSRECDCARFVDAELTQSLSEAQRKRIAGRGGSRRLPVADDVARMVEYLLGDGGHNITGSVLTVDAGNTA